jgi:hypothetical protein
LVPPNFTAVAPEKFVPVTVTVRPPAVAPVFGATPVTAGAGAPTLLYVYDGPDGDDIPLGVVTRTT